MALISGKAKNIACREGEDDTITLLGRASHLTVVVKEDGVVRVRDNGGLVRGLIVASVVVDCQVEDRPAPVGVVLLERSGALEPVSSRS